jgi:hypothetical protein
VTEAIFLYAVLRGRLLLWRSLIVKWYGHSSRQNEKRRKINSGEADERDKEKKDRG